MAQLTKYKKPSIPLESGETLHGETKTLRNS